MSSRPRGAARESAASSDAWTEACRFNASPAMRRCSGTLDSLDRLVFLVEPANQRHIYNQFVIRVPHRDRLKAHLDSLHIGNEVYYPVPFHMQPCFANPGHARKRFRTPSSRPIRRLRSGSILSCRSSSSNACGVGDRREFVAADAVMSGAPQERERSSSRSSGTARIFVGLLLAFSSAGCGRRPHWLCVRLRTCSSAWSA